MMADSQEAKTDPSLHSELRAMGEEWTRLYKSEGLLNRNLTGPLGKAVKILPCEAPISKKNCDTEL